MNKGKEQSGEGNDLMRLHQNDLRAESSNFSSCASAGQRQKQKEISARKTITCIMFFLSVRHHGPSSLADQFSPAF